MGRFFLWTIVTVAGILSNLLAIAQCSGVSVYPGNEIQVQAALDAHPGSTVFCFEPGTYHFRNPISPKSHQVLISKEKGKAILDGSVRVYGFVQSGQNWIATTNALPSSPSPVGPAPCQTYYEDGDTACTHNESVYFDNQMFLRVLDPSQLDHGKYYEDYANHQIYLRDDPTGHKVDLAVAPSIIQVCMMGNAQCGFYVQVHNFLVQKAANPSEQGAIDAEGTKGWLLEGNEVRLNHGVGVVIDGATVTGNFLHHNGESGIGGTCNPAPNFSACYPNSNHKMRILENQIAYNNTLGFSAQYAAGGGKWAATYDLLISGNYVHDNQGPGLWCDITCYNVVFEHNTFRHNVLEKTAMWNGDGLGSGIVYEVSNKAVIRYNTFIGNDPEPSLGNDGFLLAAGILLVASSNVEVYGNLVIGLNGIGMDMTSATFDSKGNGLGRTDWCGNAPINVYPDGSLFCTGLNPLNQPIHEVCNNKFHNNVLDEKNQGQLAGLDEIIGNFGLKYYSLNSGLYYDNVYFLPNPDNGTYFPWCDQLGNCGTYTASQWRAAGQDRGSLFVKSRH